MLSKIDRYNMTKCAYINAYFNDYQPFTSKLKVFANIFFLLLRNDES